MDVLNIIDGINACKAARGMTNQQIADASGEPKSTVDRILRKNTENPSMRAILNIANAVGYEFSTPATVQKTEVAQDDPYVRHIITMYENQMAANERRYNLATAEKNRWIKTLSLSLGAMGCGVIAMMLIDITTPDYGWFRLRKNHTSK